MNKFADRGYYVKENGPVYFTKDMDKTVKWFENVMGWYSSIVERNETRQETYGCVYNFPTAIEATRLAPFTGIHLFYGEPRKDIVSFMRVNNIENMYKFVKENGWEQITKIKQEAWGGKTCSITTIDGCIIQCFE